MNDFIDVIKYLHREGYSDPESTSATASSAGGLVLASAVLQSLMRGERLLGSMVLQAPFLDPLASLTDKSMPLSQVEVGEWGDVANDRKYYEIMNKYSPYELLGRMKSESISNFPDLLILCGEKDSRVPAWQSVKFITRLRKIIKSTQDGTCTSDVNLYKSGGTVRTKRRIYLLVDKDRGHFEGDGRGLDPAKAGQNDFDPFSHKAIRNIFLME
ncbi:Prolyl endopeptidase-like [Smittium mucronatum]|uniref:Prolyl endopeptidase-like n=1 Tax=Smittium mucronatum TaxID=133383 RepID=A0A1R0GX06_9FUNG|nr:Prolyl endopeptidase-like [Smittium mucronatum]